ncbi:phage tail tape measure protein [Acinetobacter baumannii]|uniref:phage tail tape measure protein n=2 Tax=Acinetobacter baumannii TaxID=470 RepID=UPI000EAA2736|nr:phage tail tape measure protein [Acinetobacter baumannii]MBF1845841.1 phage tail tape measure protein [Acinetobacter baumannii]MBS4732182.1 phage tail tape measure protein [Acinetobacter baumannii]MCH1877074.1 phage tail tape measure protein [Acinetobacter baumannii]MCQ9237630.1 phage tail tape measure protein [Acinetobacter baumannii]MCQ9996227.1 phage tail tape measure protein [Acinetobacter baumannii]
MSKLKLEVLFGAVDKLTGPMKTIVGGSKTMADALKKTNGELKDLEAQQRKISGFRQLTAQSEKTAQALAKNKQTISELKAALKINPEVQENVTALARAEAAHKRLMGVQKNQRTELTGMAQEFNKAGIQMDRLNEEESDLKNKIHLTTMELNKQKEALGKHTEAQKKYEKMQERMGKANEMAKKGLMIAGAGAAAMAIPVKIAIDYESAMADVAKVVDGLKDEAGKITPAYTAMSNQIIEMTTRLPMAAKDIAAIVAAGAQSGIAKNELIGFAESAVKMGVAFDITADQAGQSMAEMRAAFKMTQPQVIALADQINYLGNTSPNKADKIMEVVQRIGALGEVGGFASSSIAAMAASLTAVEPDVAATGIKNIILALTKGESATKGQNEAFEKLKLKSTDVAKSMQKDAEGTIATVLKAIQKLPKEEQVAITNNLFGSEALPIVMQYSQGLETLTKNLTAVSSASVYAGSMEAEYAARAATTANNIQLAKNQMAALGITIGNVLLPGVNSMIGGFNSVMSSVQKWAQANPGLSSGLVKVAVGAIAIVGGLSALSIGLITIFGPMMMVAKGFGVVALAAKGMSMALLTNPITWIVLAIAGAALLIYKNWAPISGFFVGIWSTIKTAFNGGIKGISALIINWSPIGLFYTAFAKVLSWFGIDLPAKFTGFGAMILEGLKNGILSKVNAVKDAITGAVSGVIDKARGILGIHSPSRVFMGIGGYTMQGMANGIANANGLPIAATSTATQGVVNTAAQTKPVKPINIGRNNPRSFVSQDTIEVHIHIKDGSVVKGTAEAMRQELRRVALEEQNARRKFLTDSE